MRGDRRVCMIDAIHRSICVLLLVLHYTLSMSTSTWSPQNVNVKHAAVLLEELQTRHTSKLQRIDAKRITVDERLKVSDQPLLFYGLCMRHSKSHSFATCFLQTGRHELIMPSFQSLAKTGGP
jgi:hypothetical protein